MAEDDGADSRFVHNHAVSFEALLSIYFAAIGLVVGSYLNVVIYRLPRGLSTVLPRSRCPRCRTPIRPWENVPVVSYLLLRGRCRRCGVAIHWRYPLVEAATAAAFVASYARFGPALLEPAVAAAFTAAMIALAMIDLEHFLLPDAITWPGIAAGVLILPRLGWTSDADAWLGAALGAGVLLAVAWGWYAWKGVHGMGLGDVKMLAMIGAFLGWRGTVSTLFLASFGGTLFGLSAMALGRLGLKSRLPFGVFLSLGALATLFFRPEILSLYDRLGRITVGWFYDWGLP